MYKADFLARLRAALQGLPPDDIEERIRFYSEAIDDRIEDGLSEYDAVKAIGTVEAVANQILSETPITRLVKQKMRPKRSLAAWEIVLITLGSPVWLPLLIATVAVVLSVYVSLWAIALSLWAVVIADAASAIAAVGTALSAFLEGNTAAALLSVGLACLAAGSAILLHFATVAATKGLVRLIMLFTMWMKRRLVRKERELC